MGLAGRHAWRREKEGAGLYRKKSWRCGLARAADAELELHLLEGGADLLHRLADLRGISLEGARPEVERLGLELDLRRVGRRVLGTLLRHGAVTTVAAT